MYYYVNRRPYRELLGVHHPVKTRAECILKGGLSQKNSTKRKQTNSSNDTAGNDIILSNGKGNVSEISNSHDHEVNKSSEIPRQEIIVTQEENKKLENAPISNAVDVLNRTKQTGPSLSDIRSDYFRTIGEMPL